MRKSILFLCCAGVVALLAMLLVPYQTKIIADGLYDLKIRVRSEAEPKIKSIICQAFGRLIEAQDECEFLADPPSYRSCWVKADPYAGEELTLSISCSASICTRIFGSPYLEHEYQFKGLLVIAILENGKRIGKAVEIPNRRDASVVEVVLP